MLPSNGMTSVSACVLLAFQCRPSPDIVLRCSRFIDVQRSVEGHEQSDPLERLVRGPTKDRWRRANASLELTSARVIRCIVWRRQPALPAR